MAWYITSAVKLGTPDEQAVKALQGHPETGALRGKHTNKILDNLVIVYTTHERSIYSEVSTEVRSTRRSSFRSVTGLLFCLAGGAIAFKSKLQPTIATNSIESEFIAAVLVAKIAKYLRHYCMKITRLPSTP
jgi:hypothetical protein